MKKLYSMAAALALPVALLAAEPITQFHGAVSYPPQSAGMYVFKTDTYAPTMLARNVFASGGSLPAEDGYYYSRRFEMILGIPAVAQQTFKMSDWTLDEEYTGSLTDVATAMAYDYNTDAAYGCFYNEDGESFNFASVNIAYYGHTKVADLEKPWAGAAFDSKSTLYAIDCDGILGTVDVKTGAFTPVGDTGVISDWITSAIIDPATDIMYWSVKTDTDAALYSVNLETAAATRLYTLENDEQLGGMFIERVYDQKAPDKSASSLSVSFSGINYTGYVQFRPPSKFVDGTAGSGDLKYHVYANGKEVATGDATWGGGYQKVDLTMDKADNYCFAVTFSNAAGEGPRVKAKKFVGPDVPKAPSSCTVSWTDGVAKVTWYAVSQGANGGYIDTANRRYRVTRWPDGTVVSPEDQTTTTLNDPLPVPDTRTDYYYTVECICGDKVSTPTKSAVISLGTIEPPFACTFDNAASLTGWSQLRPEGNTKTWSVQSGMAYISTSGSADYWLVTPPVRLKKGDVYPFSLDTKSYSVSYIESFEVMAGTAAEAASLTIPVIEKTTVASSQLKTFEGSVQAPEDGVYYIGVHACTPTGGGYLYVDNLSIGKGVSQEAPAAVADLAATADAAGAHKVTLTFTLPTTTSNGAALTAPITTFTVYRNGEAVGTQAATAEATQTYVDETDVPAGNVTYTVACTNAAGTATLSNEAKTFVGFNKPAAVESVTVVETDNLGEVTVTWPAATADIDGKVLGAADVTYNVLDKTGTVVAEGLSALTATFQAAQPGEHFFVQYLIQAVSEGGVSDLAKSALVPVGTPCSTPYRESFAGCKVSSPIGFAAISGNDPWLLVASDTDWGVYPADDDGGMAFLEGYAKTVSALFTGKIDMTELLSPALTFQIYTFIGSSGTNKSTLEVQVNGGEGFESVETFIVEETGDANTWNKVTVPLDNFAGRVVQVKFIASVIDMRFFWLDDVRITSNAPYNLAATAINAPKFVDPGKDFSVNVTVTNLGTEKAIGAKVELYANDELLDTKNAGVLQPEESATVTFGNMHTIFDCGAVEYKAYVNYEPDQLDADNHSDIATVHVRSNTHPVAQNLTATVSGTTVTLNWNEPNQALAAPAEKTETFDTSSSWTSIVDGWTFVDGDKATIGGIGSKALPVSGQQSFFVMDNTYELINASSFAAHSGTKFLCSMYSMKGNQMVQSDDWAISPALYGGPQTVSFWASSFLSDPGDEQYYESFEVLYSESGTSLSDFKLLDSYQKIPAAWVKYSVYLPAGAKYFAIRATSYDQYMLFVDDIEFIPAGAAAPMEVKGYNVYRNGAKVNTALHTATTFTDTEAPGETVHTYHVSAVYEKGESLPSAPAEADLTNSGINGATTASASVYAADGCIYIHGAAGATVAVYSVDGRCLYTGTDKAHHKVATGAGVFVVSVDAQAHKVAVK